MQPWRQRVVDEACSWVGKVFYEWGAQDLDARKADCSEFVIEVLKRAEVIPQNFVDRTAAGLAGVTQPVKIPLPGDLAFYGPRSGVINHVMFYCGNVPELGGVSCVVGMCGGDRYTTVKTAQLIGAACWIKSARYRADFLGFRELINPKVNS